MDENTFYNYDDDRSNFDASHKSDKKVILDAQRTVSDGGFYHLLCQWLILIASFCSDSVFKCDDCTTAGNIRTNPRLRQIFN